MASLLCGNQPVRRVLFTSFPTMPQPSGSSSGEEPASPRHRARRVGGVEDDAMIRHERAVKC